MKQRNYHRVKLLGNYFSLVVSFSIILFLLGSLGVVLTKAKSLATHFREQIAMIVYLENNTNKAETNYLLKSLRLDPAVRKADFISKEEASKELAEEIGENFIEFIGYNPLLDNIELYFKAPYLNPNYITQKKTELLNNEIVNQVAVDQRLVALLSFNIEKITLILIISTVFFTLLAMLLINSSIRMSVYANRFTIKTMQLVGAKKKFIQRPYLFRYLFLSLTSALVALSMIGLILHFIKRRYDQLTLFNNYETLAVIGIFVLFFGLAVTLTSTLIATRQYLSVRIN